MLLGHMTSCISLRLQDELRTGERAVVRFRFIKHPEYLRLGAKLLFREGVTKALATSPACCRPSRTTTRTRTMTRTCRSIKGDRCCAP
uniref:Uncharacterized protein n=1 Tax=Echeneis naucrates TaxID=173247 RepID=A0A665T1L4_ECHNA